MVLADAITHRGLIREENEDGFLVDPNLGLLAVADGMGGHQAGEVASFLALRALHDRVRDPIGPGETPAARLREAVHFANQVVYRSSLSRPEHQGMGTTLTALWVAGDAAVVAHVGDSRAYLFREGQLTPLTSDHSYVGELVKIGDITPEEARYHPHRNILTRALGTRPVVEVDLTEVGLVRGDRLLLCTDGLLEVVSDAEICQVLAARPGIGDALQELLDLTLKRGGPDNVTVVLGIYE